MDIPEIIASKIRRPVAVLGWGVSGKAVAALLQELGATAVIYDERGGEGVVLQWDVATAKQHDLVVYSPGFAQNHPWLLVARRVGLLCVGELDFAALLWKKPLVAVTGTNGKTTLTEFITFAHKRRGREAVSVGNIGYPLARLFELEGARHPLPICEVSSFQAEDMRYFTPGVVLWTNFAEDHLDRHGDMETYFRAKYKLVELVERQASRRLIVGESVVAAAGRLGIEMPAFTEVATRAEVEGKIPEGSVFSSFPQQENYAVARRYWEQEGLPMRALEEAARMFSPARHRLQRVTEMGGVTYWNDSKGTNFHAALAALSAVRGPVHWIGGGKWKGGDLRAFGLELARRIRRAYLIGETGPELHEVFLEQGVPSAVFKKLQDAVVAAQQNADSGETVLFSPGFSSFDMFKNYADRGLLFEQSVLALKNAAAAK